MTLALPTLRALAMAHACPPPTTLAAAVARLGIVQADPIQAPARAQDLILRHRVAGYRVGDLERAYPALGLEEDYLHCYGFMPAAVRALLHPRAGEWAVALAQQDLAGGILAHIRAHGETHHRDLPASFSAARARNPWGGTSKASTRALDALHYHGLLRVARRQGNDRYFTAAPPREPALTPAERAERLVLLLARLYSPMTARRLSALGAGLCRHLPPGSHRTALAALQARDELVLAQVDGQPYYLPAALATRAAAPPAAPRTVRLLAPFDPLVWERARFEHLWGWPYRFEAYTPAAKRQWGYYTHPLLWGDQIIGCATLQVVDGRLQAEPVFVAPRPRERAFRQALEAELAHFATFLGVRG